MKSSTDCSKTHNLSLYPDQSLDKFRAVEFRRISKDLDSNSQIKMEQNLRTWWVDSSNGWDSNPKVIHQLVGKSENVKCLKMKFPCLLNCTAPTQTLKVSCKTQFRTLMAKKANKLKWSGAINSSKTSSESYRISIPDMNANNQLCNLIAKPRAFYSNRWSLHSQTMRQSNLRKSAAQSKQLKQRLWT